jgi:hypothetical protein
MPGQWMDVEVHRAAHAVLSFLAANGEHVGGCQCLQGLGKVAPKSADYQRK